MIFRDTLKEKKHWNSAPVSYTHLYCNPGVGAAYSASGAFLVNQDGVRFANEKGNAWDLMQEMKKNSAQYLIMDQTSFDAFNKGMTGSKIYSDEDVEKWLANDGEGNPFMVKADRCV